MAKIKLEVQKYIQSYQNQKGTFFRVCIPNGHGSQIRKQGFLTNADAFNFATKLYLKVLSQDKGLATTQVSTLFKDYSVQWLESKRHSDLKESSYMRYKEVIENQINVYFGHFKMTELEKYHLRNYIREMQEQGVTSNLICYSVSLFKAIIKQAEIDDVVPTRGILQIPPPKHKKAEPKFWDINQTQYFLNSTKNHKDHNLWTFALYTGMRAGEIAGLKWDCVDFDKTFGGYCGVIEVKRMYNQKTRKVEETTKNGDRRLIPILPVVRNLLLEMSTKSKGEFVFGGTKNLDSSHFNRRLQSALNKISSIPKIPFHSLRHSFCSYLDSTGMSRRIVSGIMGHRDLNTTNLYSHMNDNMMGSEVVKWLENQSNKKPTNFKKSDEYFLEESMA